MITPEIITIIPRHRGTSGQRPDLPGSLTDFYSRGSLSTCCPHTPGVQPHPCTAGLSRPVPPVPCAQRLLEPHSCPSRPGAAPSPAAPLSAHSLTVLQSHPLQKVLSGTRQAPAPSGPLCTAQVTHSPPRIHLCSKCPFRDFLLTPHPPRKDAGPAPSCVTQLGPWHRRLRTGLWSQQPRQGRTRGATETGGTNPQGWGTQPRQMARLGTCAHAQPQPTI